MPIADPHCHTTASDGMVTPAELVAAAVAAGLNLIAVTDLASAHGTFLVHDDGFRPRTWRYSDVARAARGFCARLYGAGLTKGDKVVFFSENRPEWIAALWGCLLGGLVVVPIDYRASPEFLARVARIVKARLILVGQDVPPLHMPAGPATVPLSPRARMAVKLGGGGWVVAGE